MLNIFRKFYKTDIRLEKRLINIMMKSYQNLNNNFPNEKLINDEDQILYDLNLEKTKNFRLCKINIEKRNDSRDYITFIESFRNCFGKSSIFIPDKEFNQLCKEYELSFKKLIDYSGLIPIEGLEDIRKFYKNIDHFKEKDYLNYHNTRLGKLLKLTKILLPNKKNKLENKIMKIFNGLFISKHLYRENGYYKENFSSYCSFFTENKLYNINWMEIIGEILKNKDLLIACSKEDSVSKSIKISKKQKKCIIFQKTPFGTAIYSVWEKDESGMINEYKTIKNLFLEL